MNTVLVIAPHADDETLGCGGTLLRHIALGDAVHWCIVTDMTTAAGYSTERVAAREQEIADVAEGYSFAGVHRLGFRAAELDAVPMSERVAAFSTLVRTVQPQIVYLPFRGDIHTDHAAVFDAAAACTKWFRYPSVGRVLAYETLSETEFILNPESRPFQPNVFVDISTYLDRKVELMMRFEGEHAAFPFPRSEQAIRALAQVRGATAGYQAAEAFMLLKERS